MSGLSRREQASARRALRRIENDPGLRDIFNVITEGMTADQRARNAIAYFDEMVEQQQDVRDIELQSRRDRARARREQAQNVLGDDDVNLFDDGRQEVSDFVVNPNRRLEELRQWMEQNEGAVFNEDAVFIIRSNDTYYTLNRLNYFTLFHEIQRAMVEEVDDDESDTILIIEMLNGADFSVERFVPQATGVRNMNPDRNTGSFMPFTHRIDDKELEELLKKLGLFKSVDAENYVMNCLVHALQDSVSEEVLQDVMRSVRNSTVARKHLRLIGEKYNLHFEVHTDNDHHIRTYGPKTGELIRLCLYRNHYFPFIKDTGVTGYAIRNYDAVKKKFPDNWKKKKNISGSTEPKGVTSMRLMKLICDPANKLVSPIDLSNEEIWKTVYLSKVQKTFSTLEYPEDVVKLVHPKRGVFEEKKDYQKEIANIKKHRRLISERPGGEETIKRLDAQIKDQGLGYIESNALFRSNLIPTATVFFDFESSSQGDHKAYMVCWMIDGESEIYTRTGSDCAGKFLDWLHFAFELDEDPELTLIAHNVSYDISFLLEYLDPGSLKAIKKGNRFVSASGEYKTIKINFKDSWKIIPAPLKDFSKMFNLETEKELMPYDIFTHEFIQGDFLLDPQEIKDSYDEEFYTSMASNIDKWDCVVDRRWDMLKYARIYCEMDIRVLADGWEAFRKMSLEFFNIDINGKEVMTVAGMSFRHLLNQCFEDTYSVSGIVLEFIRGATVGGQTQTARNQSMVIDDVDILDQDKVSLYPSAMVEMEGIVKGPPKVFKKSIPSDADYFFVQIHIQKVVGPKYDFPILCLRDKEGINQWTNDIENQTVIIGKMTLQDLIDWNDVFEYEVIHGYYWNEGWNTNLSQTIQTMYNRRDELKTQGNPAQLIYKLLMNSSYGRTGLKPIDDDDKYLVPSEINRYITNNHDRISKLTIMPNGDTRVMMKKTIHTHYNQQHVAAMILEKAKHLMRKVLLLQQRVGSPLAGNIYYTDTDSIHISRDAWKELKMLYQKHNNTSMDLEGKKLGLFHSDFEVSGTYRLVDAELLPSEQTEVDLKGGELFSKKLYVCGKKAYMDVLTSTKNPDIELFHFRLKGIPEKSFLRKCNEEFGGDPKLLYDALVRGEKMKFTLSGMFKTGLDGRIRTIEQDREVQFEPAIN